MRGRCWGCSWGGGSRDPQAPLGLRSSEPRAGEAGTTWGSTFPSRSPTSRSPSAAQVSNPVSPHGPSCVFLPKSWSCCVLRPQAQRDAPCQVVRGPGHQRRPGGAVTSQSLTRACPRLALRAWSAHHPLAAREWTRLFHPCAPRAGPSPRWGGSPSSSWSRQHLFEDGPAQ